jgi:thiamine pyrophosphokinase
MLMKALIITGGGCPPSGIIRRLSQGAGLVIAADSGLQPCLSADLKPDYVIGDFDSVERALLDTIPEERIMQYPEDKDYTDTELAIDLARKKGADRIVLAGGGAGRLDHLLAVRALFERAEPIHEWHTSAESVFLLLAEQKLEFSSPIGTVVSVFPLSKGAEEMSSEGLKWPLSGLRWQCGDFGISNKTIAPNAAISSGKNPVLIILPLGIQALISSAG